MKPSFSEVKGGRNPEGGLSGSERMYQIATNKGVAANPRSRAVKALGSRINIVEIRN